MSRDRGRCPQGHTRRSDHPCGACRRERMLAAVVAAEPSLTPQEVTAAFDAALPSGQAVWHLNNALADNPEALHLGAPQVVGRLVGELIARGSTTFSPPACAVCGRHGRRLYATTDGGMCSSCAHRRRARVCSRCDETKPVAVRDDDGLPLCERCRRQTRGHRRCGLCQTTAAIAVRSRDGQPDVCVNCYRLPEAVCTGCGQRRPCNFAGSAEPICKGCAPRTVVVCARCGHERPPSARWPEGPVCELCYRAALHHRGTCAGCGQNRRLVHPPEADASRCADCAGVDVPGRHVCDDCGVEDRLYERGRCVRCALARRTTELLRGEKPAVPDAFVPVYEAIVADRQPYSALNWLRRGAGAPLLAELASGNKPVSHETLDAHPRRRAADYLRCLLVAHGLLDERDEQLARAERWVADLLAAIARPADRRLVAAYATWRVLRRLRRRVERARGPWTATRHAKTHLNAAVALLDWLDERDLTLVEAGQDEIDTWLATGPGAYQARDFLTWATEHGHCRSLSVPVPAGGTGTTMDPDERWDILVRLLHDDTLDLTDRVAGSLLLCYAQPLSRITALTVDRITRDPDVTTIRFGTDQIDVPQPLAGLIAALLDTPRAYVGIGSPTASPWLFPGHLPGRPLTPARLGQRLGKLGIDARAGRRAALIHLASQLPAAVLADLLHLTPGTAVRWVNSAGGDWSRYAAALVADTFTKRAE